MRRSARRGVWRGRGRMAALLRMGLVLGPLMACVPGSASEQAAVYGSPGTPVVSDPTVTTGEADVPSREDPLVALRRRVAELQVGEAELRASRIQIHGLRADIATLLDRTRRIEDTLRSEGRRASGDWWIGDRFPASWMPLIAGALVGFIVGTAYGRRQGRQRRTRLRL